MTYLKDGIRITMTPQQEAQWLAGRSSRPPMPAPQRPRLEKLADLLITKGLVSQTEIDNL